VERIRGKYKDTAWVGGSGSNNTPWTKAGYQEFINTASLNISYNDQGLAAKVTGPHTNMSYTYDTNGNLLEAKNISLGKSTKYAYDADNNLVSVEYADGKINHMVYGANGLLTEVINNDNTKVTIARNNRGEIQGITDEQNRTVTLERDIMGRITKETSPSGRTVIYEWGGTGCGSCGSGGDVQLTKITDPGNNIWEFKYDIMGSAIEMIYPDGSKIKQVFDIAGRLKIFTNKRNQSLHYSYDANGRMVKTILACPQPGPAGTKKAIITLRTQRCFLFFIIRFFLRDLCALCGEKKYFARMWQDFTTR
jgi:YD repeat-containing protein